MRAIAGNHLNVAQIMKFAFHEEENFVGKGENAGYKHFLLFPQYFQKLFFPRVLNTQDLLVMY